MNIETNGKIIKRENQYWAKKFTKHGWKLVKADKSVELEKEIVQRLDLKPLTKNEIKRILQG